MNVILFTQKDLITSNKVRLQDDRFLHIKKVHQSTIGNSVRLGEINGLMGSGVIHSLDDKGVDIEFSLTERPPKKLPLTLILALPRPKALKRIIRTIAELGVTRLILINSYKVEKSYWSSPHLSEEKIQQYLIEGLQQAKDTVLPNIELKKLFKPFVEDELPAIIKNTSALVAHPNLGKPCPQTIDKPCTLVVGPEGGFTEYEIKKLLECGFEGIHLGERILKVQTAVTALIAKLY